MILVVAAHFLLFAAASVVPAPAFAVPVPAFAVPPLLGLVAAVPPSFFAACRQQDFLAEVVVPFLAVVGVAVPLFVGAFQRQGSALDFAAVVAASALRGLLEWLRATEPLSTQ